MTVNNQEILLLQQIAAMEQDKEARSLYRRPNATRYFDHKLLEIIVFFMDSVDTNPPTLNPFPFSWRPGQDTELPAAVKRYHADLAFYHRCRALHATIRRECDYYLEEREATFSNDLRDIIKK